MLKETILSRSIRLICIGGMAAGAFGMQAVMQAAHAQDAAEKMERVEITGSSIKRIAAESSLPVQTFDQKDIQRSGVTTVTDFIQQLPVMQGFTAASESVGGGGGGITTASIHDVGEQYTLVLLNGRRIAPATSGSTIDLNSIPLAAVERVEVLTDGASALYGSDAIAGVVNFILKKGDAPFQIDAKISKPQHPGGSGKSAGLSKGFGNFDTDGYSVFLSYSHDEKEQLKASQRDFAKTGIINFDYNGQALQFFNGSSRAIPPNVAVRYTNPATGRPSTVTLNPYLQINGVCPPAHVAIGDGQCYFDYTSSVEISPEEKRDSFFGSGSIKLGNTGFKAFGDFAYTDASIISRIAPYPAEFALSQSSPLFAQYVAPYLTPTQLANVLSTTVRYRLYELGNRTYDYNTEATHLVGGVEGNAFGWDLNSAITVSRNKQLQKYLAGFPLAAQFDAALASGAIDPFPYALGQMPAAQRDALLATQFTGLYNTQDIKMNGVDARASREVFQLSGGRASLGIGADYRQTNFKQIQSDVAKTAAILFDDPQPEYDFKRSNAGAFAELVMPFTKQIEVTSSVRYDQISDIKDSLNNRNFGSTQSASTYKLGARYQPTKNVLFRAALGTGFRAPSMTQIAGPLEDFGVTAGTYECPLSAANGLDNHPLAQYCQGRNQYEVFKGGNPDLKPEKSKQWTLGTVFEPTDNITVKLDLWDVSIRDAVDEVEEALIMGDPNKYIDLYTTKFKASTGLNMLAIKLLPINIGKMENRGLDYDFTLRTKLKEAKLTYRLAGTYLIRSRYTTPGTDDSWETSLGQYGSNNEVSFRNVIKFIGTYDKGPWTHTLSANYRSGYKDKHHDIANCAVNTNDANQDCVDVRLNVPEYYTFDWQTQYRILKNLEITAGILNVFDKEPPLSLRNTGPHQLGYDPRYASPVGRTYYVSGSYKF